MDEKEYEVTITEVLEKKVRYRGRNELEATAKAEADYYAEKIVLGADDFSYGSTAGVCNHAAGKSL